MTKTAQDFTIYSGDAALPTFTVLDGSGNPINLSTVIDIVWTVQRDLASAPVLQKKKSTGGISLVSGGTSGQFQVTLGASDTSPLTGYYLHAAVVTDASSNPSTVTLGRLQIGRAPIWTYSGDPSVSNRDAVRMLIGDTDESDPQLWDGEVDYLLGQYPQPFDAAVQGCYAIAARYARKVNRRVGDLSINYSDRQKAYLTMAQQLKSRAVTMGLTIYVGGTSISDMRSVASNTDLAKPAFGKGQFDFYPPPGHGNTTETGSDLSGDNDGSGWDVP